MLVICWHWECLVLSDSFKEIKNLSDAFWKVCQISIVCSSTHLGWAKNFSESLQLKTTIGKNIHYLSRERTTQIKKKKEKIIVQFTENILGINSKVLQKWFAKFQAEDYSQRNASWSGRLVEVDNNQITLLDNQHFITWKKMYSRYPN